jgi:hypothetical protein
MPYQPETEKCEHSAAKEDVHILRAAKLQYLDPLSRMFCLPSSLDPPYNVPTETHGICGIQESSLRPLENIPLIHQIIQHLSPLRKKLIQPCLRVLNKRVLV